RTFIRFALLPSSVCSVSSFHVHVAHRDLHSFPTRRSSDLVIAFGGRVRPIALQAPDYRMDWDAVAAAVTPATRLIILNTPHNPCGVLLSPDDMRRLEAIVSRHDLYVISDEVYEHILFDGFRHESVLRYPDLYRRSFAVFSFGKSLHVTGWKTGYVIAPPELTAEMRKIHQFTVFSGNRPMQLAIARYMERYADFPALGPFYQHQR